MKMETPTNRKRQSFSDYCTVKYGPDRRNNLSLAEFVEAMGEWIPKRRQVTVVNRMGNQGYFNRGRNSYRDEILEGLGL